MKVSVIVPVYNAAEYIEHTISLLLAQTLRSMVCSARNIGIKAARGEFIGFCDADDEPDAELYETLLGLAEDNSCDISMVKYRKSDEAERVYTNELKVYGDRAEVLADFLPGRLQFGVYTKLLRRSVCERICFDESRRVNEDKMYIFEAIRAASSWCVRDVCLYSYIRRSGSASTSAFSEKYLDCIYFAEKIERTVKREYPELALSAEAASVSSNLQVLKIICRSPDRKKHRETFDRIAAFLKTKSASRYRGVLSRNDCLKLRLLHISPPLFIFIVGRFAHS